MLKLKEESKIELNEQTLSPKLSTKWSSTIDTNSIKLLETTYKIMLFNTILVIVSYSNSIKSNTLIIEWWRLFDVFSIVMIVHYIWHGMCDLPNKKSNNKRKKKKKIKHWMNVGKKNEKIWMTVEWFEIGIQRLL